MVEYLKAMLTDQHALMRAAVQVLDESRSRVSAFADRPDSSLTISERESCEALTSRFARLNDFLLQHIGWRQIGQVVQAVVLEPENVQAGLVAGHQIVITVSAPAAIGVVGAPGFSALVTFSHFVQVHKLVQIGAA